MIKNRFRLMQFFWLSMSFFVLFASYYFQWVKGLEPCPLCLMQRFCLGLLLFMCLLGIFLNKEVIQRRLIRFQLIAGFGGLYFAGRQVWLQTQGAEELGACLPGYDVLMRYFPWPDIIKAFFLGAADCGEITWQWLGLSMAAWSALFFVALLVSLVVLMKSFRAFRTKKT
jgi:disulfide bond formation protein DsbB